MIFSFVKRHNTEKDLTSYSKEKAASQASKSKDTAENTPANAIDLL